MATKSAAIALPLISMLVLGACGKSSDSGAMTSKTDSAPAEGSLHCSVFISEAELESLGQSNPDGYKEMTNDNPRAVSCNFGEALVVIYPSDQFSGAGGLKKNAASSGIKVEEGPKIGGDSQWGTIEGTEGKNVTFVSTKGNYSANVAGTDRAILEKVARALEAKFETL
jgi:hypothetical protein